MPEVIFALIIYDIKKLIERNYIIENTIVELPTENKQILQRIKISLQAINLNGIQLDENEEIEFDYDEQGDLLQRIIEKKEMYNEYQRMINRAFELQPTEEQKKKLEEMQKKVYSDETFDKEIKQFSFKERTQLKLCKLDNYCLFITSRFFNSLADHLNFILVTKKSKEI